MSLIMIGFLSIVVMFILVMVGVPIGFSLAMAGVLGLFYVAGPSATIAQIGLVPWEQGTSFTFITIPLFVLMGNFAFHSGIASNLYEVIQKWLGRLPGGLAIASTFSCAAFGAICGSSTATIATMGAFIMPEMRKYKYDMKLATGSLAASGTLGILIPPSVVFVLYGLMTETSIADLFIAGIVPGILTAFVFSGIIFFKCLYNPMLGPKGPKYSLRDKTVSLKGVTPILILFAIVIGGLYAGIFTPTEAAGIGASGAFLIGLVMKRWKMKGLKSALSDTGVISSMIFVIIIGGYLMSRLLALTNTTTFIVDFIVSLNLGKYGFIAAITILYLILGCVLDVFGMLVLTIPFLFPVVLNFGIDPIWFGVYIVVMAEVALITPPVGGNVFVMATLARDVPMETIFRGVLPYVGGELLVIILLVLFPELATCLIAGK